MPILTIVWTKVDNYCKLILIIVKLICRFRLDDQFNQLGSLVSNITEQTWRLFQTSVVVWTSKRLVMAPHKKMKKALLLAAAAAAAVEQPTRKKTSVWGRKWLQRRKSRSCYSLIFEELRSEDERGFVNYVRMSPALFETLLHKIKPLILTVVLVRVHSAIFRTTPNLTPPQSAAYWHRVALRRANN